jgi:hypothetical protein
MHDIAARGLHRTMLLFPLHASRSPAARRQYDWFGLLHVRLQTSPFASGWKLSSVAVHGIIQRSTGATKVCTVGFGLGRRFQHRVFRDSQDTAEGRNAQGDQRQRRQPERHRTDAIKPLGPERR